MQKEFVLIENRKRCKKHRTKAEKAIKIARRKFISQGRRYKASIAFIRSDGSLIHLRTKDDILDTIAIGRKANDFARNFGVELVAKL